MGQEYETQIPEVDSKKITEKLRKLGAKEEKEYLQKRWVFDIECQNGENVGLGEWIRVREVNGKTTLTYKSKKGRGINETEEIELHTNNFENTANLLSKLKCFNGKYYQENKRHKFTLNKIEFTIDTWPKIPPLLEIEAQSQEKVKEGLKLLGLEGKDIGHAGIAKIYDKYGINIHSFKELKFE